MTTEQRRALEHARAVLTARGDHLVAQSNEPGRPNTSAVLADAGASCHESAAVISEMLARAPERRHTAA